MNSEIENMMEWAETKDAKDILEQELILAIHDQQFGEYDSTAYLRTVRECLGCRNSCTSEAYLRREKCDICGYNVCNNCKSKDETFRLLRTIRGEKIRTCKKCNNIMRSHKSCERKTILYYEIIDNKIDNYLYKDIRGIIMDYIIDKKELKKLNACFY